jgi:hypothetical protein
MKSSRQEDHPPAMNFWDKVHQEGQRRILQPVCERQQASEEQWRVMITAAEQNTTQDDKHQLSYFIWSYGLTTKLLSSDQKLGDVEDFVRKVFRTIWNDCFLMEDFPGRLGGQLRALDLQ